MAVLNRSARGAWLVLALALAVAAPLAHPHTPAPPHGCTAPTRPVNDQNDVLWQRFLDAIDGFRACISAYADANQRAAEMHREAANAATLDWNRFVRAELNVPKDYPWPPPDRTASH